jgi:hypothetical protein
MRDEELRAIELEEKTERVDLANYEASAQRLAKLCAEAAALAEQEAAGVSAESAQTPTSGKRKRKKRKGEGRPAKGAVSRRAVAEATGVAVGTQRELEEHVQSLSARRSGLIRIR